MSSFNPPSGPFDPRLAHDTAPLTATGTGIPARTHVFLNPGTQAYGQPPTRITKTASDIKPQNTDAFAQIGNAWQVAPLSFTPSQIMTSAGANGFMIFNVPTGFGMRFGTGKDMTRSGITYEPGVATQSDIFYQKEIAAGKAWNDPSFIFDYVPSNMPTIFNNANLNSNVSVQPPITTVHPVGASAASLTASQGFMCKITSGYIGQASLGYIGVIYFAGPASYNNAQTHSSTTGIYALALQTDGFARLFAQTPNMEWTAIAPDRGGGAFFRYAPNNAHSAGSVIVGVHPVFIQSAVKSSDGSPIYTATLTIRLSAGDAYGHPLNNSSTQQGASYGSQVSFYMGACMAPNLSSAPVVLEMEDGAKGRFAFYTDTFPQSTVNLLDAPFSVRCPFASSNTLVKVFVSYDQPSGTNATIEMIDVATGQLISGAPNGADGTTEFHVPNPQNTVYQVLFHLTSSSTASPKVYGYSVFTNPSIAAMELPVDITNQVNITSIDITQSDASPESNSATIQIEDPAGFFANYGYVGEAAVSIELDTRAGATTPYVQGTGVMLFKGLIQSPIFEYKAVAPIAGQDAPINQALSNLVSDYVSVSLNCVGQWTVLQQTLSANRLTASAMAEDQGNFAPDTPWLVTNFIAELFKLASYPADALDIPALDVRFIPAAGSQDAMVDPYESIGDNIQRMARDYLGCYLLYDAQSLVPNSGYGGLPAVAGMWRIMQQGDYDTFSPVASFMGTTVQTQPQSVPIPSVTVPFKPPTAPKVLNEPVPLYPLASTVPYTAAFTPAFVNIAVTSTYIMKGTYRMQTIPPDANLIRVMSQDSDGVIDTVVANFQSWNFDPDKPTAVVGRDTLARVKEVFVLAPAGTDAQGVNYLARRIYAYAATGRNRFRFKAPLLLVPAAGEPYIANNQLRTLRYYDPVMFGAIKCWVRSVHISYSKDNLLMAEYELEEALPGVLAS